MLDFEKGGGLIPVIIQEERTQRVLMLGYMNEAAWEKTRAEKKVWFYSRSKKRLWMKGETSGHLLHVKRIEVDCDSDVVLIQVNLNGAVCHEGTKSCFREKREVNCD